MALQQIIAKPKGGPAKRLAKMHARRLELKQDAREAQQHAQAVADEHERAAHALRTQQAREMVETGSAGPGLADAQQREADAGRAYQRARDNAELVEQAIEVLEADIDQHARDHETALMDELEREYDTARAKVDKALQALSSADAELNQARVGAIRLQTTVDPARRTVNEQDPLARLRPVTAGLAGNLPGLRADG